jgi:very-short-patch-repair endonuclease
LKLNVINTYTDPYYGFPLTTNSETALEIYKTLHRKGYKCLSQYLGSKISMTVLCPNGHKWSGYPRKLCIPCNNCQICWKNRDLTPSEKLDEVIISKSGQLLSPYVKSNEKISIKCAQTHIFETAPNDLFSGKWCNICAGNNMDEAKKKFYGILESNGAKAITPYVNSITPVNIICRYGHEYSQVPSSTNMGFGCRYCAGNALGSGATRFQEIVASKNGQILGTYINRYTKVPVLCPKNHIFQALPSSITRGQWCIKCANLCPEQAQLRFITNVTDQCGTVLGKYVTGHTKVSIRCQWDHIFEMTPGHISEGKWCPMCWNKCPIQARTKFEDIVNKRKGTILGTYINTSTKILVRCEHNHEFEIKPNNATNGKWCRKCGFKQSKGEKKISDFLLSKDIQYEDEKIFPWLPLKRYDFYFVYNEKHYIIEYDGIQHFIQIDFFAPTEEIFNQRKQMDITKTVNALNQGYYMIRIAYIDFENIEDIIDNCINDTSPQSRLLLSDMEQYDGLLKGVAEKLNCKN